MDFAVVYPYLTLSGAVTTLVLWNYVFKKQSGLHHLPLPPGPKGFPVIGSLFDMPTERTWLEFDRWFKTYGM
jgi:hypothetical protein